MGTVVDSSVSSGVTDVTLVCFDSASVFRPRHRTVRGLVSRNSSCSSDSTFSGCLRKNWKSCFVSSEEVTMTLKRNRVVRRDTRLVIFNIHMIDRFVTDINGLHEEDVPHIL